MTLNVGSQPWLNFMANHCGPGTWLQIDLQVLVFVWGITINRKVPLPVTVLKRGPWTPSTHFYWHNYDRLEMVFIWSPHSLGTVLSVIPGLPEFPTARTNSFCRN